MRKLLSPLWIHLGCTVFFLYLPLIVVIGMSFNSGGMPTVWSGFSFKWYYALAEKSTLLNGALNTLIVALVSATIATVLGTMLALGIEKRRSAPLLDAFLLAPMLVPDIILAISLLSMFTFLKVPLGLHSIIMSHVVFNIAFVCAVVRTRLRDFDRSLVEASIDLGASALTTFRRVTLPAILPGVVAGFLLAFTLSFDEFVIAFFTAGPKQSSMTLPMHIYSMVRFGMKPEVNAMATLIIMVSFILVYLGLRQNKGTL